MADTQRLKVFKNVICPFAKHISQDRIGGVVNGTCALGYTNTSADWTWLQQRTPLPLMAMSTNCALIPGL